MSGSSSASSSTAGNGSASTVSSGGSATPAAPPAPDLASQLIARLQKDLDSIASRVAAIESTMPEGGIPGLVQQFNGRLDSVAAAVKPFESLVGLPDLAGELASKVESLEGKVETIITAHLPTLAALFTSVSRDHPHDAIPAPGTVPPPVVTAPAQPSNVRRLG